MRICTLLNTHTWCQTIHPLQSTLLRKAALSDPIAFHNYSVSYLLRLSHGGGKELGMETSSSRLSHMTLENDGICGRKLYKGPIVMTVDAVKSDLNLSHNRLFL